MKTEKNEKEINKSVAILVAHPDDETLWAGGTILRHPDWNWFIVCLCRSSDVERATKFHQALEVLGAKGIMGDLDDGPDQTPLAKNEVESCIMKLLPSRHYDLLITHNLKGEYTRHLRHEEVSKAVMSLWHSGKISASELWQFAYEDGCKRYYPMAIAGANLYEKLSENIWTQKYKIISEIYGFNESSWESLTVPHAEAFWQYKNKEQVKDRMFQFENNK